MSQRDSGYERKERDLYETPEWVTLALLPHLPRRPTLIWEPACGGGKMVRALTAARLNITIRASDIGMGTDFLDKANSTNADAIITNPPYGQACEFIWQAMVLTRAIGGFSAMLLRTDFDHAKTRAHLFDREQFAKKVVLRKRIRWFEGTTGSPSFNHAWFIWDWKHQGPPTLAYGP